MLIYSPNRRPRRRFVFTHLFFYELVVISFSSLFVPGVFGYCGWVAWKGGSFVRDLVQLGDAGVVGTEEREPVGVRAKGCMGHVARR